MNIWDYVIHNLHNFILWAFTVYLVPTYEMIAVILFLLIIDLLTGIWKAKKINQPVTLKRFGDSLGKIILYALGIVVTYVLQHHIAKDLIDIMFLFGALVCTRETKSIIENIETITNTKIWFYIKDHILSLTNKIKNDNANNVNQEENKKLEEKL